MPDLLYNSVVSTLQILPIGAVVLILREIYDNYGEKHSLCSSILTIHKMGIFDIFKKKKSEAELGWRVGGMEDFMSLIRVYYQAVMAANLGISNLAMLPDLRVFKQTMKVQTVNNKLGLGEKNKCKKMLQEMYGISDGFFKEIDGSIKKNCRTINDVRGYFIQFQAFSQDTMMLMGNLMKWKFRLPSFFKEAFRKMTEKAVHDVLTKNTWRDDAVMKTCFGIRKYQASLGYSEAWLSEYVYNILMLAKKEPKAAEEA